MTCSIDILSILCIPVRFRRTSVYLRIPSRPDCSRTFSRPRRSIGWNRRGGAAMQDDLPDETLMERIARNDTAAFDLLFQRHRRAVFSFTLRMVGDAQAAEDLTQECFLRVWRARDRYQPIAVF